MKRALIDSIRWLPVLALMMAGPAQAAPGGMLRVLLKGYWVCESGGDAITPPTPLPQDGFEVLAGSAYRAGSGTVGAYLLLGQDLTMTSGAFRGRRFVLVGAGIAHPLDAQGQRTGERCVRQSHARTIAEGVSEGAPD